MLYSYNYRVIRCYHWAKQDIRHLGFIFIIFINCLRMYSYVKNTVKNFVYSQYVWQVPPFLYTPLKIGIFSFISIFGVPETWVQILILALSCHLASQPLHGFSSSFFFFKYFLCIYILLSWVSLLQGLFSSCSDQASQGSGFSRCGAWAQGTRASVLAAYGSVATAPSSKAQAQ